MPPIYRTILPGTPYPLGATWDGLGTNFAVFSAHATRVELCLFDATGRREIVRLPLPEWTDEVWHGYVPNAQPGLIYGYRVYGPYEPQNGHRFNPHKLLLDPYARQTIGELRWSDTLFGYRLNSPRADLSFDRRDSGANVPKAIVTDDAFSWGDDHPPATPWAATVIYEAHVRGLTRLREDLPERERGTFAALADPRTIAHLQRLGITAVELLPIHAFVQDRWLLERGLRNYWGYNTLGFFAPEPAYLADRSLNEIRTAIRRLHSAGIEVFLDVVYNHTAEGSELGPTLSFRGFDNASYYRLQAEDKRRCVNDTGTGNTVNVSHPRVLQMVMDSLRYWVTAFHIDGFRFDLGATLGREANGFDPGAGFFDAVRQDPVLAKVKLISEPWDIGPGGYQLSNHPPGFAEWNDRFRDGIRRFWRGDSGQRPDIATRLAGSGDLFDRQGRRPWASINYVASHDGFTLADIVSYVERHNEANGEENRDGHGENYTANWGAEGSTDDLGIRETRSRIQRAMLATVFFANGTPMLLAGDEFGRSQQGNNNAYCQDSELSWLDWKLAASPGGTALTQFVARLIQLRRRYPVLRCAQFLHGRSEPAPGILDIDWFDEEGQYIAPAAWQDPEQRSLILRRATQTAPGQAEVVTLLMNPTDQDRCFRLPEPVKSGRVMVDTADPDGSEREVNDEMTLSKWSAVLLASTYGNGRS
jgi:isoamylase